MNRPERRSALSGCGLGLRRGLLGHLEKHPAEIAFLEAAPENWINVGGPLGERFSRLIETYPLVCHGLSLSLGGPTPLDFKFLQKVKNFLHRYKVRLYSEHLSYCTGNGHLYDLMPIPFTEEAARYVTRRIVQVQDFLEQKIAVENASAYVALSNEMSELEFVKTVAEEADCYLLLDVNNVYVNSVNFDFDPVAYIEALPKERIAYCHVAGHSREDDNLIVDTHGAGIIKPVWQLLDTTYRQLGVIPTLLERDFNFPPFQDLLDELRTISRYQKKHLRQHQNRLSENPEFTATTIHTS